MKKENRSQVKDIAFHLRRHKKITSLEAIKRYGATRLSGIIYILKNRYGFVINTEIKIVKNRYGHNSPIAIYHLEKDGDL